MLSQYLRSIIITSLVLLLMSCQPSVVAPIENIYTENFESVLKQADVDLYLIPDLKLPGGIHLLSVQIPTKEQSEMYVINYGDGTDNKLISILQLVGFADSVIDVVPYQSKLVFEKKILVRETHSTVLKEYHLANNVREFCLSWNEQGTSILVQSRGFSEIELVSIVNSLVQQKN